MLCDVLHAAAGAMHLKARNTEMHNLETFTIQQLLFINNLQLKLKVQANCRILQHSACW